MLIKNLIVMAVLVAVASVGVRSWYINDPTVKASGLTNVKCLLPEDLEVAVVAPGTIPATNQWQKASEIMLNGTNYSFLQNMNMTQVTGDGISFIKPYLMQYGVVAAVDSESEWDSTKIATKRNEDYLSFDLYMRTAGSNTKIVVLSDDTYCGPVDPNAAFSDSNNPVLPASAVGSLRMSVTNAAATNESRKLLWIPAPNIYHDYDQMITGITNTNNEYALQYMNGNTKTNVYGNTVYTKGTYNHTYWDSNKGHHRITYGTNKASDVTANNNCDYKLHDTVTIGTLNTSLKTLSNTYNTNAYNSYYYDKCRFNFWFEGEDPEARAAQVGGNFKSVLHFSLFEN